MRNIAVIFAGGFGRRMNINTRPKQFLEYRGKPVIIYTLELFEKHPLIDGIVVACLEGWIPFLQKIVQKFKISKILDIVPGGQTGQDSIYNGLMAASNFSDKDNCVVLIHDGVRPLIREQTITDNIYKVLEEGSCITCIPTTETFMVTQPDGGLMIPDRDNSLIARAPQSFYLHDILSMHKRARAEGLHDFIDSCTMMYYYGYKLGWVVGPVENIKITTSTDFFVFKAMIRSREIGEI